MLIYRVPSVLLLACALGVCCAPVEADVISIADTSVSLSSTSIAFFSLSGPGSVTLGAASTGAFAGLGGSPATLQSISAGSFPIANFLSIPTLPNAHFTLTLVAAGSANTNCAAVALSGSCSPFAGSPFVLTRTLVGTVLSFSASGTVADNSGATTPFTSVFSTEISAQTPAAVQTTLLASGTLQAPFSAALQVAAGPFAGSLDIGVPTLSLASLTIGFTPPAMTLGPTSTGLFASLSGSSLSLQNLNAGSFPVNNFLSLSALPNVDFTLTSVFAGSANTNCAVALFDSCSPFAGSPFVLLDLPTGVVVSFSAGGTALDAVTSLQTPFDGTFMTEVVGVTPLNVAALLNGGGGINASFAAEFTAGPFASRPVPEPATLVLLTVAIVGALVSRARSPTRRV